MKRRHLAVWTVAVLALLCTAGCVPRPSMYYWGNYSETLYRAKKTPGDDTLLAHRQSLENIVEQSKTLNLRVPPGVYAELGTFTSGRTTTVWPRSIFRWKKISIPSRKS